MTTYDFAVKRGVLRNKVQTGSRLDNIIIISNYHITVKVHKRTFT